MLFSSFLYLNWWTELEKRTICLNLGSLSSIASDVAQLLTIIRPVHCCPTSKFLYELMTTLGNLWQHSARYCSPKVSFLEFSQKMFPFCALPGSSLFDDKWFTVHSLKKLIIIDRSETNKPNGSVEIKETVTCATMITISLSDKVTAKPSSASKHGKNRFRSVYNVYIDFVNGKGSDLLFYFSSFQLYENLVFYHLLLTFFFEWVYLLFHCIFTHVLSQTLVLWLHCLKDLLLLLPPSFPGSFWLISLLLFLSNLTGISELFFLSIFMSFPLISSFISFLHFVNFRRGSLNLRSKMYFTRRLKCVQRITAYQSCSALFHEHF